MRVGMPDGNVIRLLGAYAADVTLRQAVAHCWTLLPKEKRSSAGLRAEFLRLTERALRDFEEDIDRFALNFDE